jgi:hypothetical protein
VDADGAALRKLPAEDLEGSTLKDPLPDKLGPL